MNYVSNGANIDGCLKGTERYSRKVVYENALVKTAGQISVTANTTAGFNTEISTILGTAALVVTSIEEEEDWQVTIDPFAIVASSLNHINQLSEQIKWMRL